MKKMLVTLSIVGLLFGSNAYAGSCEVPKFLKTGKTYTFTVVGLGEVHGKILEIDDSSCWIKSAWSMGRRSEIQQETEWFNLAGILAIKEK